MLISSFGVPFFLRIIASLHLPAHFVHQADPFSEPCKPTRMDSVIYKERGNLPTSILHVVWPPEWGCTAFGNANVYLLSTVSRGRNSLH